MIPNHDRPLGPEHCEFCRMYHENARYRALIDGTPAAETEAARCRHAGDTVSGGKIALLGLDLRRTWWECARGMGEIPGIVCTCRGCGPKCPEYSADD